MVPYAHSPCPCIDSTVALWVAIKKSSCVWYAMKSVPHFKSRVISRRGFKARKWLHDWRTVWLNQLLLHYTRLCWTRQLFHVKISELLKKKSVVDTRNRAWQRWNLPPLENFGFFFCSCGCVWASALEWADNASTMCRKWLKVKRVKT